MRVTRVKKVWVTTEKLEPDYEYIVCSLESLPEMLLARELAAHAGVVGSAVEIGTVIDLISYFFLLIKIAYVEFGIELIFGSWQKLLKILKHLVEPIGRCGWFR